MRRSGCWVMIGVAVLLAGHASAETSNDTSTGSAASVPAFPGAEGYGSATRGGRGGRVIAVTNLNDSGPGSLREACTTEGPRIVVFRVSGTIILASTLKISKPYITIAGQTAPGDGICIRNYPLSINASEVIIRYIRVRMGDETGVDGDAMSGRYQKNIILDHVSAGWSVDETLSIYHCRNVTIQWCLVSESLYASNHIKGTHGYGGIWGSNYSTYHHNLLAHHSSRNPRFASGCGYNDYRNNVIYNWGYNSAYGGERQEQADPDYNSCTVNMVANYYKPGPATRSGQVAYRIINPSSRNGADDYGKWYVADNFMCGNRGVTMNNWNGGVQPQDGSAYVAGLKLDQPWAAMTIYPQTAEEAYLSVLDSVGACLPKRDTVDTRIIDETRNGCATYGGAAYQSTTSSEGSTKSGIIDSQKDVGGWPELKSLPAPADSDSDGMPDEWELRFGFNPDDASDGPQDKDGDGYANVEEYLNGTDPLVLVDYTRPENNVNTLRPAV